MALFLLLNLRLGFFGDNLALDYFLKTFLKIERGNVPVELRRYRDIIGIKIGEEILGFHARNLQVAELDEAAWKAFEETASPAKAELETWHRENDPEVEDATIPQKTTTFAINITQICNLRCTYCAAGGD